MLNVIHIFDLQKDMYTHCCQHLACRKQLVFFLIATFFCVVPGNAQQIAVHTNLLTDVLATPNVGVDFVVGNRLTIDADITGSTCFLYKKDRRFIEFHPEVRYWLNGRPFHKLFLGVGLDMAIYDFATSHKVQTGSAFGGGITFGYAFKLASHWTLTASTGCSLLGYWQKEYYTTDHYNEYTINGQARMNASGCFFIPTNVGVTISYLFK